MDSSMRCVGVPRWDCLYEITVEQGASGNSFLRAGDSWMGNAGRGGARFFGGTSSCWLPDDNVGTLFGRGIFSFALRRADYVPVGWRLRPCGCSHVGGPRCIIPVVSGSGGTSPLGLFVCRCAAGAGGSGVGIVGSSDGLT